MPQPENFSFHKPCCSVKWRKQSLLKLNVQNEEQSHSRLTSHEQSTGARKFPPRPHGRRIPLSCSVTSTMANRVMFVTSTSSRMSTTFAYLRFFHGLDEIPRAWIGLSRHRIQPRMGFNKPHSVIESNFIPSLVS
jgi:hypothetical protein